jgi:hypothetical protein
VQTNKIFFNAIKTAKCDMSTKPVQLVVSVSCRLPVDAATDTRGAGQELQWKNSELIPMTGESSAPYWQLRLATDNFPR